MFLTHKTIKRLKSVLSEIPDRDAPGSARLGEALAAGFGFADYHAMKQELDRLDTDLKALPLSVDLDFEEMVARLGSFSVRSQFGWDLAATALHVFYGKSAMHVFYGESVLHLFSGDGDEPPLRSARFDLTTEAWRSCVIDACREMAIVSGGLSWHMRIPESLSYDDEGVTFPDDKWGLLVSRPGAKEPAPLTVDDLEIIDRINQRTGLHPRDILESGAVLAWDILPGSEFSRIITLDAGGLRVSCASGPDGCRLDILLADALLMPGD